MADATSPFLNKPLRSRQQAAAEIARGGAQQAAAERLSRLQTHGATFGRMILDGAFERTYEPDGSYRLRPVAQGSHEPPTPADDKQGQPDWAPAATGPQAGVTNDAIVRHSGYCAALRDLSCWVAAIALRSRMDSHTLAALNAEIARLSQRRDAEAPQDGPEQALRASAAGTDGSRS
jgi:hypothetical protein